MVVDRQQADQRQVDPAIDGFDRVVGRDLAAQVQPVLGARHAPLARLADRFDHARAVLHPVGVAAYVAQRQRIEHRGDAGGGDLRVVRHDRGSRRPVHAGARREVLLQLSVCSSTRPGTQIVALEVDVGGVAAALADVDDEAVAHHDGAVELGVGGDDAGVGEDDLGAHACAPGQLRQGDSVRYGWRAPRAPRGRGRCRRWPCRVARSRIRSTTTSRLAASSEAVGSSSSSTG